MSACRYRMHAPGDTCDCKARLAAVTTHTRTSTGGNGPDFCEECSRAISDWVPWPCADAAPASPDPTPGEEGLSEAEREAVHRAHVHISPRDLFAAVERILAARLATLRAEHKAEVEGLRREVDQAERAVTVNHQIAQSMLTRARAAEAERDQALAEAEAARREERMRAVDHAKAWAVIARVEALTWYPATRDAVSGNVRPPWRKTHVRVRDIEAALTPPTEEA